MWLLRCSGGPTVDCVAYRRRLKCRLRLCREPWSRTCRLDVRCWLGCRSRGDGGVVGRAGCLSLLLSKSLFHSVLFRALFRRSEPGHVAR